MNSLVKWTKRNQILMLSLIGYVILFAYRRDLGWVALQRSGYYFKEMIEILPAVFVLTSLIQTWVPTEVVVRNFGQGAGVKGTMISVGIGSLSAGPIYAAFPVCRMLLQKGASIRNIVIILGTWAVVKVPMLINEVKFMGFRYMIVRWVFTILAILFMGYLMDRVTNVEDLPVEDQLTGEEPLINDQICVGCGACVRVCPQVFKIEGKKAVVMAVDLAVYRSDIEKAQQVCPVKAFNPLAMTSA